MRQAHNEIWVEPEVESKVKENKLGDFGGIDKTIKENGQKKKNKQDDITDDYADF